MDAYTQPKRALSGGFQKTLQLDASAVTQVLVTCPQTTPSDHPKKHYIHVQRLRVVVKTGADGITWTVQDANGTPLVLTPALDMSVAGAEFVYDFGPQGFKCTLNKDLKVSISGAGAAADVFVEGFYERSASGAYILVIASVSPVSGPAAGGTVVRVFGQNFRKGCTVTIGGVAAVVKAVYLDDGQSGASLDCTSGAHAAGAVDVIVTNPDAVAVTSVGAFTYV